MDSVANNRCIRRRFVILEHDHPFLHWDFLIEKGEKLDAWRLLEFPKAGMRVDALPLPDHRRCYLEYEGPISGDRGSVRRVYSGTLEEHPTHEGQLYRVFDSSVATQCRMIQVTADSVCWEFE